jgi:hypothetical protein
LALNQNYLYKFIQDMHQNKYKRSFLPFGACVSAHAPPFLVSQRPLQPQLPAMSWLEPRSAMLILVAESPPHFIHRFAGSSYFLAKKPVSGAIIYSRMRRDPIPVGFG